MSSATELERLFVTLVADTSKYTEPLKAAGKATVAVAKDAERASKRFAKVGAALEGAASKLRSVASGMRSAGASLSTKLTAPIAAFGTLSVKAFADFDSAMTKSLAIQNATSQQIERMKQQALELGGSTLQGPSKLAESYFFLASAGLDAEQQIKALPAVAGFATAGMFDMSRATDLLTDAQSALGMTVKDAAQNMQNMGRVSDVLVKANTLANASVEQFSESLTTKAGAALKTYNKSVEEGVAVLAAYADQGVKAELAGNALDRVMRLLSSSALNSADAHQRLGFNVFDANGQMRNMADIVKNLEQVTSGMSDQQRNAALDMLGFESRVQQAILPLLGTSDAIRTYEKELRKAAGTTEQVANNQLKSFSAQMKILWNQITVAAVKLGEMLAPAVLWLNDMLKAGLKWWDSLGNSAKYVAISIAGVTAAIGPMLAGLGVVAGVVASAAGALSMLAIAGIKVVAVTALISGGLAVVVAGLASVTAAVVGTVAYLVGQDGLSWAWGKVTESMSSFFSITFGFFSNFQHNVQALTSWFVGNWDTILLDAGAMVLTFTKNMILNIQVAFNTMVRLATALMGSINQIMQSIFSVKMVNWVIAGINKAIQMFRQFKDIVKQILVSLLTGAAINAGKLLAKLPDDFKKGMEEGFIATSQRIMKEGAAQLYSPLEGFESKTKELPDLILKSGKELHQAAKQATASIQEEIDNLPKDVDFTVKVHTQGLEALEAGTKAAYERLLQHRAMLGAAGPVAAKVADRVPNEPVPVNLNVQHPRGSNQHQQRVEELLSELVTIANERADDDALRVVLQDANL